MDGNIGIIGWRSKSSRRLWKMTVELDVLIGRRSIDGAACQYVYSDIQRLVSAPNFERRNFDGHDTFIWIQSRRFEAN